MPSRRVLKGVLCNFLGTYTSRYSEYDGYWLFGFLVEELATARFDLLAPPGRADDLLTESHRLAARLFADQLAKSGLDRSAVVSAMLDVKRGASTLVSDEGWQYEFRADATTETGKRFECATRVFVAPHDPKNESRSTRASEKRRVVRGRIDE